MTATEPSAGEPGLRKRRPLVGWIIFGVVLLALIIVPFLIWAEPLEKAMNAVFATTRQHPATGALVIIALLAGDVVLPIPSSLVSAFAGAAFSWAMGTAIIWVGMTLGCIAGYGLGASAGRGLARFLIGEKDLVKAKGLFSDIGPVALIVTRAVPVLAEASTITAGATRMPFVPFMLSTSLANVGVAVAYAAAGSAAAHMGSFLIVFLSLCLVPALAWAVWRMLKARSRPPAA